MSSPGAADNDPEFLEEVVTLTVNREGVLEKPGNEKLSKKNKIENVSPEKMANEKVPETVQEKPERESFDTFLEKVLKDCEILQVPVSTPEKKGNEKVQEKVAQKARPKKVLVHVCITCGKEFRSLDLLAEHKLTSHIIDESGQVCRSAQPVLTIPAGPSLYPGLGSTVECLICDFDFNSQEELYVHIDKNHTVRACPGCVEHVKSRKPCKDHGRPMEKILRGGLKPKIIMIHPEKPIKCRECGNIFYQYKHLMLHSHIHSIDNKYKCSFCGQLFSEFPYLNHHVAVEHPFKGYVSKREKEKISTSIPKPNREIAEGEQASKIISLNAKCVICQEKVADDKELRLHIQKHHTHKCLQCGQMLESKDELKIHVSNEHNFLKKLPFCCLSKTCTDRFATTKLRDVHVFNIHRELSPYKFKCQDCSEIFMKRLNYAKHMEVLHNKIVADDITKSNVMIFGVKDFKIKQLSHLYHCPQSSCPKRFALLYELLRHLKDKHPEVKYLCRYCCETFTTSVIDVGKHIYKCHEKDRPGRETLGDYINVRDFDRAFIKMLRVEELFEKQSCKKTVHEKNVVMKSNVKTFSIKDFNFKWFAHLYYCPESSCPERFALLYGLLKHLKVKHPIVKFLCRYCCETFTSVIVCGNHVNKHHEKDRPNRETLGDYIYMRDLDRSFMNTLKVEELFEKKNQEKSKKSKERLEMMEDDPDTPPASPVNTEPPDDSGTAQTPGDIETLQTPKHSRTLQTPDDTGTPVKSSEGKKNESSNSEDPQIHVKNYSNKNVKTSKRMNVTIALLQKKYEEVKAKNSVMDDDPDTPPGSPVNPEPPDTVETPVTSGNASKRVTEEKDKLVTVRSKVIDDDPDTDNESFADVDLSDGDDRDTNNADEPEVIESITEFVKKVGIFATKDKKDEGRSTKSMNRFVDAGQKENESERVQPKIRKGFICPDTNEIKVTPKDKNIKNKKKNVSDYATLNEEVRSNDRDKNIVNTDFGDNTDDANDNFSDNDIDNDDGLGDKEVEAMQSSDDDSSSDSSSSSSSDNEDVRKKKKTPEKPRFTFQPQMIKIVGMPSEPQPAPRGNTSREYSPPRVATLASSFLSLPADFIKIDNLENQNFINPGESSEEEESLESFLERLENDPSSGNNAGPVPTPIQGPKTGNPIVSEKVDHNTVSQRSHGDCPAKFSHHKSCPDHYSQKCKNQTPVLSEKVKVAKIDNDSLKSKKFILKRKLFSSNSESVSAPTNSPEIVSNSETSGSESNEEEESRGNSPPPAISPDESPKIVSPMSSEKVKDPIKDVFEDDCNQNVIPQGEESDSSSSSSEDSPERYPQKRKNVSPISSANVKMANIGNKRVQPILEQKLYSSNFSDVSIVPTIKTNIGNNRVQPILKRKLYSTNFSDISTVPTSKSNAASTKSTKVSKASKTIEPDIPEVPIFENVSTPTKAPPVVKGFFRASYSEIAKAAANKNASTPTVRTSLRLKKAFEEDGQKSSSGNKVPKMTHAFSVTNPKDAEIIESMNLTGSILQPKIVIYDINSQRTKTTVSSKSPSPSKTMRTDPRDANLIKNLNLTSPISQPKIVIKDFFSPQVKALYSSKFKAGKATKPLPTTFVLKPKAEVMGSIKTVPQPKIINSFSLKSASKLASISKDVSSTSKSILNPKLVSSSFKPESKSVLKPTSSKSILKPKIVKSPDKNSPSLVSKSKLKPKTRVAKSDWDKILATASIPIPESKIVKSPDKISPAASESSLKPKVVKAPDWDKILASALKPKTAKSSGEMSPSTSESISTRKIVESPDKISPSTSESIPKTKIVKTSDKILPIASESIQKPKTSHIIDESGQVCQSAQPVLTISARPSLYPGLGTTVECLICDFNFNSQEELYVHIDRNHTVRACQGCVEHVKSRKPCKDHGTPMEKTSKGGLKPKIIMIHPKKPIKCRECGNIFYQYKHLMLHSHTHSINNKYKCSFCGQLFSELPYLNHHVAVEHPFKAQKSPDKIVPSSSKPVLKLKIVKSQDKSAPSSIASATTTNTATSKSILNPNSKIVRPTASQSMSISKSIKSPEIASLDEATTSFSDSNHEEIERILSDPSLSKEEKIKPAVSKNRRFILLKKSQIKSSSSKETQIKNTSDSSNLLKTPKLVTPVPVSAPDVQKSSDNSVLTSKPAPKMVTIRSFASRHSIIPKAKSSFNPAKVSQTPAAFPISTPLQYLPKSAVVVGASKSAASAKNDSSANSDNTEKNVSEISIVSETPKSGIVKIVARDISRTKSSSSKNSSKSAVKNLERDDNEGGKITILQADTA